MSNIQLVETMSDSEVTLDESVLVSNVLSKNAQKKLLKQERLLKEKMNKKNMKTDTSIDTSTIIKTDLEESKDSHKEPLDYYTARYEYVLKKQSEGITMYPDTYETTLSIEECIAKYDDLIKPENHHPEFCEKLQGRIRSIRQAGSALLFVDLSQGMSRIQVMLMLSKYESEEQFRAITSTIALGRGDIIVVDGYMAKTKTGELSIVPRIIRHIAPCLHMLPSVKDKLIDIETRYQQRYLDFICNPIRIKTVEIFSRVESLLRKFFSKFEKSIEIRTPILSESAGGAVARPFLTFHNDLKRTLSLRISPELYLKQFMIAGLYDVIFELGPVFRNESIDRTHSPEFYLLEAYFASKDYNYIMVIIENLFRNLVQKIMDSHEITLINAEGENITIDFSKPFPRYSFIDEIEKGSGYKLPLDLASEKAFEILNEIANKFHIECHPRTNSKLLDRLAGYFIESKCIQPSFIVDYPTLLSPLAKRDPTNPHRTQRFELFINGTEYSNGYTELNNPFHQAEAFDQQARQRHVVGGDTDEIDHEIPEKDAKYVRALEYGLINCAGVGIGVTRLASLLARAALIKLGITEHIDDIREVLTFPCIIES
jgi:lysyl-tRNA synthetase class 2